VPKGWEKEIAGGNENGGLIVTESEKEAAGGADELYSRDEMKPRESRFALDEQQLLPIECAIVGRLLRTSDLVGLSLRYHPFSFIFFGIL
jgi:hypothetical protein